MNAHNICFYGETIKKVMWISLLSRAMVNLNGISNTAVFSEKKKKKKNNNKKLPISNTPTRTKT